MPEVTTAQLVYIAQNVLDSLDPIKLLNIAGLGKYKYVNMLMKKGMKENDGGKEFGQHVLIDNSGTAKWVGPYESDTPNFSDHTAYVHVPFALMRDWMGWDTYFEEAPTKNAKDLAAFIESRRADPIINISQKIEASFTKTPVPGVTGVKEPYGLKYFIPQLASGQNGIGYYGGCPTGFTDVAGITPCASGDNTTSAVGNYQDEDGNGNYCCLQAGGTGYYTAIDSTWEKTMVKVQNYLDYEAPYKLEGVLDVFKLDHLILCGRDAKIDYEMYARNNLDNVDLATWNGVTAFRRIPIIQLSGLNSDTALPFYWINTNYFHAIARKGWVWKTDPLRIPDNQPTVIRAPMHASVQTFCSNRKAMGVVNKTA